MGNSQQFNTRLSGVASQSTPQAGTNRSAFGGLLSNPPNSLRKAIGASIPGKSNQPQNSFLRSAGMAVQNSQNLENPTLPFSQAQNAVMAAQQPSPPSNLAPADLSDQLKQQQNQQTASAAVTGAMEKLLIRPENANASSELQPGVNAPVDGSNPIGPVSPVSKPSSGASNMMSGVAPQQSRPGGGAPTANRPGAGAAIGMNGMSNATTQLTNQNLVFGGA